MRVISGIAKGHKLKAPKGYNTTRPTSDYVKEALFNILGQTVVEKRILDLYAGTGGLGIEALSRGAEFCVFVDNSRQCRLILQENLDHTKLRNKACVVTGLVDNELMHISKKLAKFDIIFMDPPYRKGLVRRTLETISQTNVISDQGLIVVEHCVDDVHLDQIFNLKKVKQQKYRDTVLSFYELHK